MGKQHIATFITAIKADADRFMANWIAQREAHGKADWPMRMPPEEWHEQFTVFLAEPQTLTAWTSPDAAEVARFTDYMNDKATMPAEQFAAKWATYEEGSEP